MKVLMVTSTFPRWRGDSIPAFVLELAERISARGIDVIVLAPHTKGAKICEAMGGVSVRRFCYFFPFSFERVAYGGGVLPNLKTDFFARMEFPLFLLSQFLNLLWIVKKEKIDIIHIHWILPQGLAASIVRKIIKFRYILTSHAGMRTAENTFLNRIAKFILAQADIITTNSQWNAGILSKFSEKRIEVIPMGVETSKFTPLKRDEKLRSILSDNRLLVLGVGRWVEVKGYKYLIMAVKKVVKRVDIRLILIGFGPEEGNLRGLAERLGMREVVKFIKGVRRDEIDKYFATSDIFVLPSVKRGDGSTEGFGLSLIEAMASGVAVIGSAVGGIVDIIKDRDTGILSKEKDPEDLAEKILLLAEDPMLRKRLGENGREFVEKNFSWNKTAGRFLNLYEEIYNNRLD